MARDYPSDLGGKPGFGRVDVEIDEPPFHEPWEGRVRAMAGAIVRAARCGTPGYRHAIERMEPHHYLAASYYERWLTAGVTLVAEHGLATDDELNGLPRSRPDTTPRSPVGDDVVTPRFRVGDAVRVRAERPQGHTRCPGYLRGKRGVVVRYDGPCNFDDVEAHSDGRRREPLYCVAFDAEEVWGRDAEMATVHADLFDAYLETPDP